MPKKVLNANKSGETVLSGSPDERQYIESLTRQLADVNEEFVDFVARSKACSKNVLGRRELINSQYNQRLFMMISRPLQRGVNKESLLETIGVAAGAMLMSPDFRKACSASVQNIMYPYVQKMAERSKPGSFWERQAVRMDMVEHGGRLPLTPQSAAIMHLGFSRNAYNKMREPGADVSQIMQDYQEAVDTLYNMAQEDGLSSRDVHRSVRTIAGQLIEKDSRLATCFNELAFDDVVRGQGEVRADCTVWRGEYLDRKGKPFRGAFTPREPMDADHYATALDRVKKASFKDCKTSDEMYEVLSSEKQVETRQKYMTAMFTDGLSDKDVKQVMGRHMDDMYGTMFEKLCQESFSECKSSDEVLAVLESDEAKDKRSKYIELMFNDGLDDRAVQACVSKYIKEGVLDWAHENGIELKDDPTRKKEKEDPKKQGPSKKYQKPRPGARRPASPDPQQDEGDDSYEP